MTEQDFKADLHRYLRRAREAVVWKLDGLSDYDARRPLVPTGTLDAIGHVPWWPAEHDTVTLHRVLVHMTTETDRHAGHADIVRELIDGAAGLSAGISNLPSDDRSWWRSHYDRVEDAAREASR